MWWLPSGSLTCLLRTLYAQCSGSSANENQWAYDSPTHEGVGYSEECKGIWNEIRMAKITRSSGRWLAHAILQAEGSVINASWRPESLSKKAAAWRGFGSLANAETHNAFQNNDTAATPRRDCIYPWGLIGPTVFWPSYRSKRLFCVHLSECIFFSIPFERGDSCDTTTTMQRMWNFIADKEAQRRVPSYSRVDKWSIGSHNWRDSPWSYSKQLLSSNRYWALLQYWFFVQTIYNTASKLFAKVEQGGPNVTVALLWIRQRPTLETQLWTFIQESRGVFIDGYDQRCWALLSSAPILPTLPS